MRSRTFGNSFLLFVFLQQYLGRLAVEAVLIKVADQKLPDGQPRLRNGLQRELPQKMVLEAFGKRKSTLDELPPRVTGGFRIRAGVAGVRGMIEEVPVSLTLFTGGQGVQGDRGAVLYDLESRIFLQLFLDGCPKLLQGQGHEPHRLVELRRHFKLLDLLEDWPLGLHETSAPIVRQGGSFCQC